MSSNSNDNRVVANNWVEGLRHATDDSFNTDPIMCFLHEDEMALTFHADNGECIGIVCIKCFNFLAKDCSASTPRIARTLLL